MIVRCRRCDAYFYLDDARGVADASRSIVCAKCREPLAVRRRRLRNGAHAEAASVGAGAGAAGGDGNGGGRSAATAAAAPTIEIGVARDGAGTAVAGGGVRLDPRAIDPALAAVLAPESPEADLFKRLRTRLFGRTGPAPRTVLVTSALAGEGKTVVAANLAASIGRAVERHALLVDANPRRPRAAAAFGLTPARGLLDWLAAPDADLASYILRLPVGRLSLLPLGEPVPTAPELLASARMRDLLDELADRYEDRTIVLDGSSLSTPEALALAAQVDGVLLAVRAGMTPAAEVERACKSLGAARLLGIALNHVEATEAR